MSLAPASSQAWEKHPASSQSGNIKIQGVWEGQKAGGGIPLWELSMLCETCAWLLWQLGKNQRQKAEPSFL